MSKQELIKETFKQYSKSCRCDISEPICRCGGPLLTLLVKKPIIASEKDNKTAYATRDLFSVIIILKILLEKEIFNEFYSNIIEKIEKLETQLFTIKIDKVLYKMGFPKNYKNLFKL